MDINSDRPYDFDSVWGSLLPTFQKIYENFSALLNNNPNTKFLSKKEYSDIYR